MNASAESERAPVASAIIVNNGEVLLVRRRVEEGELSWQFPAGKVDPGESGEDAAVRETREETGLTVRAAVHPSTGRTMLYIACEVVGGTAHVAAEDEIAEVAWCGRVALATRVPHSLHGPVQEHLDARLR